MTEKTKFVQTLFLSLYPCLKKPTKEAKVVGIVPKSVIRAGEYNVVDLVLIFFFTFAWCR